jgi:hypothetical protein
MTAMAPENVPIDEVTADNAAAYRARVFSAMP